MDEKEKLSVSFYYILVGFRDTFSLPTDSTLAKCLKLSALLTVVTGLLRLFGLYTFLSWQGCLLCTVILVALLWVERSENDALLRMYSDARVLAEKTAQQAKAAGASLDSRRREASARASQQKDVKGKQHGHTPANKGHSQRTGGNK